MKQEYFNIDDYDEIYDNVDHLNPDELETINGDNVFFAFLEKQDMISLNCVAAIDGQIYNFHQHKYLEKNTKIVFAKSFSDIMPSDIWRLIHIVNYDIISIDIDDNKSYIFDWFEEYYKGMTDINSENKILRNGFITPKFKRIEILNKQNLININDSNIFLAILENSTSKDDYQYFENENLIKITYEGIDLLSKFLKDYVKKTDMHLPAGTTLESWIEKFKKQAIYEMDKYWYSKMNESNITANFIGSINGNIYNFCTNKYLDYNQTKINYATPIKEILPKDKWRLSYSDSGRLTCITVDDDYIDTLIEFECNNNSKIDKEAKTKVLRNDYKIKP